MKKFICTILSLSIIVSLSFTSYATSENTEISSIQIQYESDESQALSKPTLKVSGITDETIKLKWSKINNADKYQIYYSTKKDGTYKKYRETSKTSITVKGLETSTEYFFKVRALKEDKKGKFSSILQTNTEFTVREFNVFIQKLLNRSDVKKKFGKVEVICGENSYDSGEFIHDMFPYDVRIIVKPENMWTDLYNYKYSGKMSKSQKAEFLDKNIKLQYLIFSYANRMLPEMKIQGGYFDSYYEYPTLKLGLVSKSAFTWVNYSHAGGSSEYSDTEYIGKMEWFSDFDDYDFSLTDDMIENINLNDILK
ncbi:MAG: fibronectin type III domain-containing protein [Bacteroides sp.]|nr:fibronectin type III domain-containing protein [Eubacterium sp.]MCM1463736.1 fibronectin type III domain-containing protein [Bacteroides sp.]